MSGLSLVTLFALLAAVSWGVGDFFGAKASKTIGPVTSMFAISLLQLPIFIFFYLLSSPHWVFNGVAFLYAIAAGIAFTLAGILFFKGLDKGPVSLVSPVASMYPLVTTISTVFIFHSHISLQELLGIMFILIGILAASGMVNVNKSERKLSQGVWLAIITAGLWGLAYSLFSQAINRIGWQNSNLIEISVFTITMLILVTFIKGDEVISKSTTKKAVLNKYVALSTAIGLIGLVSITIAISKSTRNGGAVATAISSCYPLITILLALNHFKEKVKPIALTGALIGIAGVILLTLT